MTRHTLARQLAADSRAAADEAQAAWEDWLSEPAYTRVGDRRHGDRLHDAARRLDRAADEAEATWLRKLAAGWEA